MAKLKPRPYNGTRYYWLLSSLSVFVYFAFGSAHRLPVFLLTAFVFPLAFSLFPEASPDSVHTVSPHNLALLFFFLLLVVEPINLALFDPESVVRQVRGYTDDSLTSILLIVCTAFVSYAVGYSFLRGRTELRAYKAPNSLVGVGLKRTLKILPLFWAMGLLAFVLTYGSISSYVGYLANPAASIGAIADQSGATMSAAASAFLRPFGPFACIAGWCLVIDRRWARARPKVAALISISFATLIVLTSASFNRGAMAAPILTMLAIYSTRVRRVSVPTAAAVISVLLVPAIIWGAYRGQGKPAEVVLASGGVDRRAVETSFAESFAELDVQAHALDEFHDSDTYYWGATIPGSVLYTVPVLGRPFREGSGYAIYNTLVRGSEGQTDQIIPVYFELFINFHIFGVIAGFFCFGLVMLRMQKAFLDAGSGAALKQGAVFLVAIWTAALVFYPITVLCQMIIYNFGPAYICFWWFRKRRARSRGYAARTRLWIHQPMAPVLRGR